MRGQFLLKLSPECTTTALKNPIEKAKRNPDKICQIEVKSFIIKHFYTTQKSKTFKFIQLFQI